MMENAGEWLSMFNYMLTFYVGKTIRIQNLHNKTNKTCRF